MRTFSPTYAAYKRRRAWQEWKPFVTFVGYAVFAAVFMVICANIFTDNAGAARTLEIQGFTPIRPNGYSLFGCSQDDLWRTEYIAKAPNGSTVRVVVCEGIFKGSTVRIMGEVK